MAEQSVRVEEGSSGDYIATRDAEENDSGANARTIHLVTDAERHHDLAYSSITRTVTASDGIDFGSDPTAQTDIVNAKITMGDKSTLVVGCHFLTTSTGDGYVEVTPLVLDSSNKIIGFLDPPKVFQGFDPSANGALHYGSSGAEYTICNIASWPTQGASFIGLHITLASIVTDAKIWAAAISGPTYNIARAASHSYFSYFDHHQSSTGGGE